MKDKLKSKMVWKGNYLTVDNVKLACINPYHRGDWLVWVELGEVAKQYSTEAKAKEAAEQAVIDWFERVLG